jgi:hypothetical protein
MSVVKGVGADQIAVFVAEDGVDVEIKDGGAVGIGGKIVVELADGGGC